MATAVDSWADAQAPVLKPVLRSLREVCVRAAAGGREYIYHGAICYAAAGTPTSPVIYIMPQRGYVNLGFYFGTAFPDPDELLEGTGKRMRHVKVRATEEATRPSLRRLVESAWRSGPAAVEDARAARKHRPGPGGKSAGI